MGMLDSKLSRRCSFELYGKMMHNPTLCESKAGAPCRVGLRPAHSGLGMLLLQPPTLCSAVPSMDRRPLGLGQTLELPP